MKERPILFRGRLVRRILAGAKTQTRRIAKVPAYTPGRPLRHEPKHPGPYFDVYCSERKSEENPRGMSNRWCWWTADDRPDPLTMIRCPYGAPGDRLWVREAFQLFDPHPDGGDLSIIGKERLARGRRAPYVGVVDDRPIEWTSVYRADGELEHPKDGPANWKPSIHMPRWASRILLEVTAVRVERLQDISEEDAIAEGVAAGHIPADEYGPQRIGYCSEDDGKCVLNPTARAVFEELWDSINGKPSPMLDDDGSPVLDDDDRPISNAPRSWASNPFVWVVEFKRIAQPLTEAQVRDALAIGAAERRQAEKRTARRKP